VASPRAVRLIDARDPSRPFIAADLRRDCPAELLDAVEQGWAAARQQLAGAAPVEHAHWNWRNKSHSVATGRHRLVAIECEGQVQGLMALDAAPRGSGSGRGGLIYVDYLESAPWNVRAAGADPRFIGVGTALLVDAVRLSREEGHEGRVGLHSLPQAEPFYARCGLTRIGRDPGYYDLAYYEFTGPQAVSWLASIGEQP
jgi:hypothetical protein